MAWTFADDQWIAVCGFGMVPGVDRLAQREDGEWAYVQSYLSLPYDDAHVYVVPGCYRNAFGAVAEAYREGDTALQATRYGRDDRGVVLRLNARTLADCVRRGGAFYAVDADDVVATNADHDRHIVDGCRACVECHEVVATVDENGDDVDDAIRDLDGVSFCPTCYDEVTAVCDRCGDTCHRDDAQDVRVWDSRRHVYHDRTWCETCADRYTNTCRECDDACDETIETNRGKVCRGCVDDHYRVCDGCSEYVFCDDAEYDDDGTYCRDCYRDHQGATTGIGAHGSTSRRGFHPLGQGPLFFGVEWELEAKPRANPAQIAETVREWCGEAIAGCEADGSLDRGVECVTQPMSLARHRETWTQDVQDAVQAVAEAHDTETCGLHVHATRAAIGGPLQEIKLAALLDDASSRETWTRIFRRSPGQYRQAQQLAQRAKHRWRYTEDRYRVLNFQNEETVELRWPKGTTNTQTIMATVECYHAMIQWLKTQPLDHAVLTSARFLDAVYSDPALRKETPALRAYLARRGIGRETPHKHAHGTPRQAPAVIQQPTTEV